MAQISEAKQVSISKTSETLYCIHCERMVSTEQGANGLKHADEDWREEVFFCHFPDGWAVCPPPETEFEDMPLDMLEDWAAQDDDQKDETKLYEMREWLGME